MATESTRFIRVDQRPATVHPTAHPAATAHPAPTASAAWPLPRVLVVLALLTEVAAVLVFRNGDVTQFASPEAIPFYPGLIATLLVLHRATPRRYLAAGITLAILPLLVLVAFGGLLELANPLAGASFQSVVLLVMALLLGTPAGVQGYRAGKAGKTLPAARAALGTRHGVFAVLAGAFLLGAVLVGAMASGAAVKSGSGGGYDVTPAASRAVTAQDFAFSPAQVSIPAGQLTEIAATNKDGALHTFTYTVGGQTFSHDLTPGATTKFLVKLDAAGTVNYWCEPHKPGMSGTLAVA
jgi:plastocyanin